MAAEVGEFIARWERSAAHERANFQPFIHELCGLLGLDRPDPAGPVEDFNAFVFERSVTFHHANGTSSSGRIDLYKRGCFVMEAKQGGPGRVEANTEQANLFGHSSAPTKSGTAKRGTRAWDDAMLRARHQAENYAKALPASEGWPPFLVVVDVGHVFELYADFTGTGKHYSQFPDANRFRFRLADLQREEVQKTLKAIWTDPHSLDPSRQSARVTRQIAAKLAELAKAFEAEGHHPETVSQFLMRCLFTMFAEDVRLIPAGSFRDLLKSLRGSPQHFVPMVEDLWRAMDKGTFSTSLREQVRRFNGGLFTDTQALPIDGFKLGLLIDAAEADWKEVEPAIFGTLVERALNDRERHKLGAHYTPRPYVERLVIPTIIEPLRSDWQNVQAAAIAHAEKGRMNDALEEVRKFHNRLCETKVLDPACGTGNFLYVTLEHMKRIEGEVIDLMREIGGEEAIKEFRYASAKVGNEGVKTVDPHQFLGLEVNPRAVAIAELVLWIGYLQWNVKTFGTASPTDPVLRDFKTIRQMDAVLAWDGHPELARDEQGRPLSRWDGLTFKTHPVTGEAVPDESARKEVYIYKNPRPQVWPEADFVVGNPPFIGAKYMRSELGDGYIDALSKAYPKVPQSADYVMFWWEKAALAARAYDPAKNKGIRRFGFITTNSLPQTFSRRVVQQHLDDPKRPLSLVFAIPDHPWVQESDGAAVRIAMTVGQVGRRAGRLLHVLKEEDRGSERLGVAVDLATQVGRIAPNLRIGADLTSVSDLRANDGLSCPGVKLHGSGFIVSRDEATNLGLGRVPGLDRHIRPYRNGRDLTARPRDALVIDLFGLQEREVRDQFPDTYQWVLERVKPQRDGQAALSATADAQSYAEVWWIFGKPRPELRKALNGLPRYIVTPVTAKHRFFQFQDASILPDDALMCIASDDALHLGVLSSRIHVVWALASGARLGIGNDPRYIKTRCFDPFPFPDASETGKAAIRDLAERIDAHRKERQRLHPDLTLTGLYNVLEKLKAGGPLDDTERDVHVRGLVGVLKQLHDDLDEAVSAAYGWAGDLSDEEVLSRLVTLNHTRAAEERRGTIRWLRPTYQNPTGAAVAESKDQIALAVTAEQSTGKPAFPKALPEQVEAVRLVLENLDSPATAEAIARAFKGAKRDRVTEVLQALVALGHARRIDLDRYAPNSVELLAA